MTDNSPEQEISSSGASWEGRFTNSGSNTIHVQLKTNRPVEFDVSRRIEMPVDVKGTLPDLKTLAGYGVSFLGSLGTLPGIIDFVSKWRGTIRDIEIDLP
jgi:hypothetical protein